MNPFRCKSAPEPSTSSRPFLVAPNSWSTDATAKVFGYVRKDDLGRLQPTRSHSAGLDKGSRISRPSKEGFVEDKSKLNKFKTDQEDNDVSDFVSPIHCRKRDDRTSVRQSSSIGLGLKRDQDRRGSRRSMRTVSQDDELTQRGANPRTGVISPYVTSDGSTDGTDKGYITGGYAKTSMSSTGRRTSSGRWQQIGTSWSFVENAVASPTSLQPEDTSSHQLAAQMIQEPHVARQPEGDKPGLTDMSSDQIKRYHESVERACNPAGGGHGMVDPESLPTPRQSSPAFGTDCPSSPPRKLHKIRRKEVGSAGGSPEKSDETTIVSGKQQQQVWARPPPMKISSNDRQHVRIISPTMLASGVSARTPLDEEASFLGLPQQGYRTASAGPSLSTHPLTPQTNRQGHRLQPQSRGHMQSQPEVCSALRVTSPTLNQFLPRLQLLPPSHFANLESPSYRRQAHLLPPSLRSGPQKRQLVEDAATITTTITSDQKLQRPGMQRLEGRSTVPRASHRNFDDHIHPNNHISPSKVPQIKVFEPSSPILSTGENVDVKSSKQQQQQHLLCPSRIVNSNIQRPMPGPAQSSNNRFPSKPPQAHPEVLSASLQNNDGCHVCQGIAHLTAPAVQDRNNNGHTLTMSPVQTKLPSEISSGPGDHLNEVSCMANMATNPNHCTPQRPSQQGSDCMNSNISQAAFQHSLNRGSQDCPRVALSASAESEITKAAIDRVEKKVGGSPQNRQDPVQASVGIDGVVHAARVAMLEDHRHRHERQKGMQSQERIGHGATSGQAAKVKAVHGIASETSRHNVNASVIGTTQAHGVQDRSILGPGNGTDTSTRVTGKEKSQCVEPSSNGKVGVSLTGNGAGDLLSDTDSQSVTTLSTNAEELLARRQSFLQSGTDLGHLLAAIEEFTQAKARLNYVGDTLWYMTLHVTSTLQYSSPAISILRSSFSSSSNNNNKKKKFGGKEMMYAMKEVALAIAYALILFNVTMLLRKIVLTLLQFMYWIWHPFTAMRAIIRWCLIA